MYLYSAADHMRETDFLGLNLRSADPDPSFTQFAAKSMKQNPLNRTRPPHEQSGEQS